jgi:hypothetical protein
MSEGDLTKINAAKEKETPLHEQLEPYTGILAIAAVVIYATGFLVVSSFLDRFGVRESGGEFFKIRYMHVGLLYMLFPGVVLAPIFAFFHVQAHRDTKIKMPTIAILNIGHLILLCYWFATFANPGYFHTKALRIVLLFGWTLFWITSGRRLAGRGNSEIEWLDDSVSRLESSLKGLLKNYPAILRTIKDYRRDMARATIIIGIVFFDSLVSGKLGLIALVIAFDIFLFLFVGHAVTGHYPLLVQSALMDALRRKNYVMTTQKQFVILSFICAFAELVTLWSIPTVSYAFFYYSFCFLAVFLLWHDGKRIKVRCRSGARPAAWFCTFCIVGGLLYIGIMGFAYGVYPHIPLAKGGGDYSSAPDVELYWKKEAIEALPTNLFSTALSLQSNLVKKSVKLKIIEETESQVFVADPSDHGGPANWMLWSTPKVIALKKDEILSIVHSVPENFISR